MMRHFLEMSGLLGPRMDGLEDLLDDVATGRVLPDEAATQIRSMAQHPRQYWARKAIVFLPLVGGALFLIVGTVIGIVNYRSVADTIAVDGRVTQIVRGKTHFEYIVNGVTHSGKSWVQSDPPAHSVGDKIRVLYRPENPAEARIDSFVELWLFSTVFPLAGLFSMIAGGVAYFALRRYQAVDASQAC